jgi:glycosyltransferase involved in cell wall biosynthesis
MRILIVISGLTFGGAERQVVLLSRELVRLGHAVLVYTLNRDVPRRAELDGSGVELVVDCKRARIDVAVLARLRARIVEWRADVVHSFLYDADVYARLAAWGLGVAVINSERNAGTRLKPIQRLGYRLTRARMDGLVANSWAGAALARARHGASDQQIHVVWNGIDLAEVDRRLARSERPALALWPGDDLKRVCVVGAIKPQKDHLLALDVARELHRRDPRWRFTFVGDALERGAEHKANVLQAFEATGAAGYAAFVGVRTDVIELIASSDVLLVTSHFEGFPNVVLEAMACRTPVATTDYSDVRRIVPFAWQVAVTRQPEELADTVERCDAERAAIAAAQREWVERHATTRQAAANLLRVYQRYTTRPPALGEVAPR